MIAVEQYLGELHITFSRVAADPVSVQLPPRADAAGAAHISVTSSRTISAHQSTVYMSTPLRPLLTDVVIKTNELAHKFCVTE